MEMSNAFILVNANLPPLLMGPLADIGVFLAASCRSLSLARPATLEIKAYCSTQSTDSKHHSHSLATQALSIVSDWRQQPEFMQEHRDLCSLIYWHAYANIGNLADIMQSAYLVGIETEKRILRNSHKNAGFILSMNSSILRSF